MARSSMPSTEDNRVLQRRDSLRKTLAKVPWERFVVDQTLELVTAGTGFAVSLVASPAGGLVAEKAVSRVLEYTVRRFTHVYERGEVTLSELFGRTIPDQRYSGVGDFWGKVVHHQLEHGALIEVLGFLSPYGPLMPAHPMSRPGYTVEGWQQTGDLGVENTEEYDTRDGFIYGDRVIRLSSARQRKYYAGLYDPYFGISNVAIPMYVEQERVDKDNDLKELWKYPLAPGKLVKVKGRLRALPSFYAQFATQLPNQYRNLPSFGLEVFELETMPAPGGVTHMAVTASWKRRGDERMLTHYFNVQDDQQFKAADSLLEQSRKSHSRSLLFNYDDLACFSRQWRHKIPEYNEMLKPWLEGQKLYGD